MNIFAARYTALFRLIPTDIQDQGAFDYLRNTLCDAMEVCYEIAAKCDASYKNKRWGRT